MLRIISGKFKNHRLHVPKGNVTRPTSALVRSAVFNILQCSIEDAHVLDLCAGSGAMGLEALSRGANHVTFVEKERFGAESIKKNIELLGCQSQAKVYMRDAFAALKQLSSDKFDLIYIDPPYDAQAFWHGKSLPLGAALIYAIDQQPCLSENGSLFLEISHHCHLPEFTNLTHLRLVDSRLYGKSSLFIFQL